MKLRKRELAVIVYLVTTHGVGARVNAGLILSDLEKNMCMSKKIAKNSIRRLAKLGFLRVIRDEREILVEVQDPIQVLKKMADDYIHGRQSRCFRS